MNDVFKYLGSGIEVFSVSISLYHIHGVSDMIMSLFIHQEISFKKVAFYLMSPYSDWACYLSLLPPNVLFALAVL